MSILHQTRAISKEKFETTLFLVEEGVDIGQYPSLPNIVKWANLDKILQTSDNDILFKVDNTLGLTCGHEVIFLQSNITLILKEADPLEAFIYKSLLHNGRLVDE